MPSPTRQRSAAALVPRPQEDPRYTAAVIPTTILAVLAQFADEAQVPVEPWLAGLGLTRVQIDDAAVRVSFRQASVIIRRAQRTLPLRDLGLAVGSRQTVGTFGIMGLAMMTARTFGEAVAIGVENAAITGALMDVELEAHGRDMALVARPRFADDDILVFLCEELFASTFVLARSLVGPAFAPTRLELTYPAPPYASEYRALFGCEVKFGARRNRVIVERRWLEVPLATHHPVSAQQALTLCREQAAQIKKQSEIVAAVERILRRRLAEQPTLAEVADSLNLSQRNLRRHLSAVGQGWREIHDRLRTERALELLSAGVLSVADIGSEVGFSDAREFRRAFKRWTGTAPTAARALRAEAG